MTAAHDYFATIGVPLAELRPLMMVMGAFRDHDRGKPSPVFAIKRRSGQRGSVVDDMFKACVAATMTAYQRQGWTKQSAAKHVGTALDIPAKTVDGWHREISSERHPDPGVISSYKLILASGGSPEAMLATLPTLLRQEL